MAGIFVVENDSGSSYPITRSAALYEFRLSLESAEGCVNSI
jgi:hypothetical protein